MKFIDKFLYLCNLTKKSPSAVCEELGLSRSAYTYWKSSGNLPRDAVLVKMAEYFDVSPDYIRDETAGTLAEYHAHKFFADINNDDDLKQVLDAAAEDRTVGHLSDIERELILTFRQMSGKEKIRFLAMMCGEIA